PGIAGLGLIIGAALAVIVRLARRRVVALMARPVIFSAGRWRTAATFVMWLAIFMLLGVPIASLISYAVFFFVHKNGGRIRAWSAAACIRGVGTVPQRFGRELIGTSEVAAGAATIALLMGGVFAWRARRGGWLAAGAILAAV